MKDDNKVDRILANVGEAERREIKGLIEQLEANGARLVNEDVRMLVSMTTEERYKFLQMYQRN
jgi:Mg/Co/Ni transporter MgtE